MPQPDGGGAPDLSVPGDLAAAADDLAGGASAGDLATSAPPHDLAVSDAAAPLVCTTLVSYGATWIHGGGHPAQTDTAAGTVTWDGRCTDDGANSYATLSNGWKPYFTGHSACMIALDPSPGCGAPAACTTRVSYGASWLPPANHPNFYDDVAGRVFTDGVCSADGSNSFATLSNGWLPHFSGANACALSFAYSGCGGLYTNPVIPFNCPDPGVVRDGDHWVLTCTSGNAADAFPIYTSSDLVSWSAQGHIFPSGSKPTWAASDFWAPEIHRVGTHWVAYFTARTSGGRLSVGAASAPSALGPFTDIGQPLVTDANMGLIDASEFADTSGAPYLVWKEDGNAVGKPTPIHGQPLRADGLALTGSRADLITNDQSWEGGVVEGPWVVARDGYYYLFYSGNSYANASYALGVARASSPLGPYAKQAQPIVVSNATWIGPGHCSVVDTPAGDTYVVYHAWAAGHVNGPGDGRMVLTDALFWRNGWPVVPAAPSVTSRPLP